MIYFYVKNMGLEILEKKTLKKRGILKWLNLAGEKLKSLIKYKEKIKL